MIPEPVPEPETVEVTTDTTTYCTIARGGMYANCAVSYSTTHTYRGNPVSHWTKSCKSNLKRLAKILKMVRRGYKMQSIPQVICTCIIISHSNNFIVHRCLQITCSIWKLMKLFESSMKNVRTCTCDPHSKHVHVAYGTGRYMYCSSTTCIDNASAQG